MKLSLNIGNVSGTHAEIGKKLGLIVVEKEGADYFNKQLGAMKDSFLYTAIGMRYRLDKKYIDEAAPFLRELLSKYHSDLLLEIEEFSQELNQPLDATLAFLLNYGNGKGCTHLFVNGLHGHNYDDHPRNVDMQFLTLQPTNSFNTAGFSSTQVGRFDGINEKGLTVSLSWGAGELGNKLKLSAELFIRIILDKASNVDEAIDLFNKIGYGSPNNLLISDASSNAVVIENSGRKHNIKKAERDEMLYCTNSYLSPEMQTEQKYNNPTTIWRERFISSNIKPNISKAELRDFLTANSPNGLFEPYYKEELGTLWSVIFEPKERLATILLGEKENRVEKVIDLKNLPKEDTYLEVSADVPEALTSERNS